MGNKQLQGRSTISYITKNGIQMNIKIEDLQGANKFPKKPKKEEILKRFEQWKQEVILQEQDIQLLQTIESKYKFRIYYIHYNYLNQLQQSKQRQYEQYQKTLKILEQNIEKLQQQYNELDMNSIITILQEKECIQQKFDILKNHNIVNLLIIKLGQLEETSRITNNFREQLKILELFSIILNIDGIKINQLFYEKKTFKMLFSLFHPIEPKLTGMMLKLFAGQRGLSWQEDNIEKILDAMLEFQNIYKLSSKFDILIRTIYLSKNIVMIYLIVKFIFRLLYSIDETKLEPIITELNGVKINDKKLDEIFKQIKLRIKLKLYKKEDATYEAVRKSLIKFTHPLASGELENPRLTKQFASSFAEQVQTIEDNISFNNNTTINQEELNQNFLDDSYYYYEIGQESQFQAIEQSVVEWLDSIQNFSLFVFKQTDIDQNFLEIQDDHSTFYFLENGSQMTIGSQDTNNDSETTSQRISHKSEEPQIEKYKNKYKKTKQILEELQNQLELKNQQEIQISQQYQIKFDKMQNEILQLNTQINQLKEENKKLINQSIQIQNKTTQQNLSQNTQLQSQPQLIPPPPPPPITIQSNNTNTSIASLPPPPPPPPSAISTNQNKLPSLPPPPPPPIPFQNHQNNKIPPPPIPGQQVKTFTLCRKTTIQPSKEMKQLFWTVIPDNKAQGTVFEKIQNEDFKLDVEFLENCFSKQQQQKQVQQNQLSNINQTKNQIKLLTPERIQTISIVLGKFKLQNQVIINALYEIDKSILTEQVVNSLNSICPTQEEVELLQEFNGETSQLGLAEQFVDQIKEVNGFSARLKALQFYYIFQENSKELNEKIKLLNCSFQQLQNSEILQTIILITLRLGNFLNAKNSKGNAASFKIEAIEKCSDIKSTINQITLLTYVIKQTELILKYKIQFVESNYRNNKLVIQQYELIEKLSISQLIQNYNELKKGQKIVKNAIDSQTEQKNDKVKSVFDQFYNFIEQEIKNLNKQIEELDNLYKKCAQYYCENPQDSSDKFGEKIMKIIRCLEKTKKQEQEIEERTKRAEELKNKQKQNFIQRNEQISKTVVQFSSQQNNIKPLRESLVAKEIKEMQNFKQQKKWIK